MDGYREKSELIKEIQRLERNIRKRVEHIESREDLPQFGAESFRKYEKRKANKLDKKRLTSLSEKDLTTLYRDIKYLNDLRSLNIKGAEYAKEKYLPIKNMLETFSPDMREKFKEAYSKLVSNYALTDKYFKYEVQGAEMELMLSGQSNTDEIYRRIKELFDETLFENPDANETELRVLFADKLKNISQRFE